MASKPRLGNRSKLNLFLDIGLAAAFAVAMEEHFTGLQIHEWLGLFFGAIILVHIVLHWNWIVSITRQFFRKLFHESRLNYVLNVALFVDMVAVVVTGILISRTLGLSVDRTLNGTMEPLHRMTSYLVLILIAAHVALHWKWIVTHTRKYLFRLPSLPRRSPQTAPVAPAASPRSLIQS